MARSFGLVDTKVQEAEYFLSRILAEENSFFAVQCDAVAFASSARSITFALQSSLSGVEGFGLWYAGKRDSLKADPLARFFHEFRRVSQHIGENLVSGGSFRNGRSLYFFGSVPDVENVPDMDVASACEAYFKRLLEIVYECYMTFPAVINGQWYFTKENFAKRGLTIENAEVELGLPVGWSGVSGLPEEVRWKYLRKEADGCSVQRQFTTWLGKRVPHPDDET
jgi:hypothetical protein